MVLLPVSFWPAITVNPCSRTEASSNNPVFLNFTIITTSFNFFSFINIIKNDVKNQIIFALQPTTWGFNKYFSCNPAFLVTEDERIPDLRRCERIRWPKPVIEHSEDNEIKVWENDRKGEKRICIWFEAMEYLVVLAKRKDYILFWTAYLITKEHRKRN